jgi:hypothetical protein
MPDFIIPALLLIDGLICIMLALFAHEIGLDPTPTWGQSRFAVLFLGLILASVFPLWVVFKNRKTGVFDLFRSEPAKTWGTLGHLWAFIFLVYAWFITYGNFTTWDHTTHYYTQLADAFGKGQLHVDLEPGQALLEAPDPYDQTSRPPFSDEVWDLSLYKEKLYLYWGPVPALVITPIQAALNNKITDNYLVFFFFASLLIVNSLIIVKFRKNFFPKVPEWTMFVCIGLIGLILHISWSLNVPNVYTAAIGAGQFFLLGGLYFIFLATDSASSPNKKHLFLAGLFWAGAVGSRAMNVLSVVFLAAFTTLWIARNLPKPIRWPDYLGIISALYVPLIFGAVMIGWYNWARFDSPLEFGLRYQITIFNLNRDLGLTFRPEYFFLNLYTYIFQPFELISKFPFIQPITTSTLLDKFGVTAPHLYLAGRLTGILFGAPFLMLGLVNPFSKNRTSQISLASDLLSQRGLIIALLAGSFLINFLAILFFFFAQMRYLVDIISQITLLAILGYWRILSSREMSNSFRSRAMVFAANSLIVLTLCTSLLLALTGEASRMEKLNPAFFDKINSALSISK